MIPRSDLVRSCGYVSTRKDGRERLNFTAFYEALLEAKGMHLGGGAERGKRRPGRHLSYSTKVLFNGNLLVGSAYTAQLGLRPGDAFAIKLGRNQIRLVPAGCDEDGMPIAEPAQDQPADQHRPGGEGPRGQASGRRHRGGARLMAADALMESTP